MELGVSYLLAHFMRYYSIRGWLPAFSYRFQVCRLALSGLHERGPMATAGFKRKLTAVFSADVAGYSRLMGEDEAATLTTLEAYKIQLESKLKRAPPGRQRSSFPSNPGKQRLSRPWRKGGFRHSGTARTRKQCNIGNRRGDRLLHAGRAPRYPGSNRPTGTPP